MLRQQLKNADELPGAGSRAVSLFEVFSQLSEDGGQRPVLKNSRMIEVGRLATENNQVVYRVQDVLLRFVASLMMGNRDAVDDRFNPVDIRFDRRRSKGVASRNAVPHAVESDRLILVDFAMLLDARIERMLGQVKRTSLFRYETLTDRLGLARCDAIQILLTAMQ
jgi:hypothetical protein